MARRGGPPRESRAGPPVRFARDPIPRAICPGSAPVYLYVPGTPNQPRNRKTRQWSTDVRDWRTCPGQHPFGTTVATGVTS
ncbi:unnamed protein product, partial [Iphiclides podalirius]